jgi:hypothetical protein
MLSNGKVECIPDLPGNQHEAYHPVTLDLPLGKRDAAGPPHQVGLDARQQGWRPPAGVVVRPLSQPTGGRPAELVAELVRGE